MDELRKEAQKIVLFLIDGKYYSKMELAKLLGISYPTLYKRIELCSWTGKEINIINTLG